MGVGIDAERIERFVEAARSGDEVVMPHVFSARELGACRAAPDPAAALAAAHCCKEALLKATRSAFAYPEAELLDVAAPLDRARRTAELTLSPGLASRLGVGRATAELFVDEDTTCVAVVHAFAPAAEAG